MIWLISIAVFVSLVLVFVYHFLPSHTDTIKFFATTIGVATAAVGLVISSIQLFESARHQRQSAAYAFHDKWQDLPIADLEPSIQKAKEMDEEDILTYFKSDSDAEEAIVKSFNFFEDLGIAVRYNFADEYLSCTFYQENAVRYYAIFDKYIRWFRQEKNRPGLYENYEWIAKRWADDCPR